MTNFDIDKQLEEIGLSQNDFFYSFDNDLLYHWSGIRITPETLAFPTSLQQFRTVLDHHIENLPDKEERLAQFRLYQKRYTFIREFKEWLSIKITEGLDLKEPTDEEKQKKRREKRREYINDWEVGQIRYSWHPRNLTDKVPMALKQSVIEALDFIMSYEMNLIKGQK